MGPSASGFMCRCCWGAWIKHRNGWERDIERDTEREIERDTERFFFLFFFPFLVQNKELQSGRIFWRHHRPSGFVSPAQLCPVSGCWPWRTAGGLGADSDRRSEVAAGSSCTGAAPCIASCPRILVQNWGISPLKQACFDKFLISFTLMPVNETDA